MLDTGLLQVTGRGHRVNFAIDDSLPLETVIQELRRSLAQNQLLYSKGSITVEVGRRLLAPEELTEIKRVVESDSGLTISQFWCSPATLEGVPPRKTGLSVTRPAVTTATEPVAEDLSIGAAATSVKSGPDPVMPADDRPEDDHSPLPWLEPEFPVRPYSPSSSKPTADEQPHDSNGRPGILSLEPAVEAEPEEQGPSPAPDVGKVAERPLAAENPAQGSVDSIAAEPAVQEPEPAIHAEPSVDNARTVIHLEQEVVGLYRGNEALLVKTTCRSGEIIRYPGDIVVLADVNPGAEIIADGDILVFGTLRGLAHAGAGGDIQATIIAVRLEAPRLRIGPHTGMAPKTRQRSKTAQTVPMIAYVRRQHIFVAPFAGRFARYNGGTQYDG